MNPAGRPPRRLLFLADIGGPATWHVGDEAMLEANLALFRRLLPDAVFAVASADPAASGARLNVAAVARLDPGDVRCRAEALDRLRAMSDAAIAGAAAPPAMQALLQADGLVISGGGNLCSTWPGHILERLAMARLAAAAGRPVCILGQTIGPWLDAEDRPLVAELLRLACWVGVREAASYALARELGVAPARLHLQADDAAALVPPIAAMRGGPPVILITLHPFTAPDPGNARLDSLAAELHTLATATGAALVFLPHAEAGRGGEPGDLDLALALQQRLPLRLQQMPSVTDAVAMAAGASLIVSSRYHPIVFGLAAGVPCLGLPVDEYTRTKLHGALAESGQGDALFALDGPDCAGLADRALALWQARDAIREQLIAARAAREAREAARAARLGACLSGADPDAAGPDDWIVGQLAASLAARGAEITRLGDRIVDPEELRHLRRSRQAAEDYALDLAQHLARTQAELRRSVEHGEALSKELAKRRR